MLHPYYFHPIKSYPETVWEVFNMHTLTPPPENKTKQNQKPHPEELSSSLLHKFFLWKIWFSGMILPLEESLSQKTKQTPPRVSTAATSWTTLSQQSYKFHCWKSYLANWQSVALYSSREQLQTYTQSLIVLFDLNTWLSQTLFLVVIHWEMNRKDSYFSTHRETQRLPKSNMELWR